MPRTKSYFKQVENLRKRYLSALPGKESLAQLLNEVEISEQVYNSNAIENSTLTLEETEKILLKIDLNRFITERELFEAKNLAHVVEYMEKRATEQPLTKDVMLLLHKVLLTNIRDDIAGRFRNAEEWVRVGNYVAANPKDIDALLTSMLTDYAKESSTHIVKRLAHFHLTFERIHPFIDGNGRMGRAMNNYVLLREGFVPIVILFAVRDVYYQAFKEFDATGATTIMENVIGLALRESYHKRLAYMEGKRIITLNEYGKINTIALATLLNKARRQTIEAFREKGKWKIGV